MSKANFNGRGHGTIWGEMIQSAEALVALIIPGTSLWACKSNYKASLRPQSSPVGHRTPDRITKLLRHKHSSGDLTESRLAALLIPLQTGTPRLTCLTSCHPATRTRPEQDRTAPVLPSHRVVIWAFLVWHKVPSSDFSFAYYTVAFRLYRLCLNY